MSRTRDRGPQLSNAAYAKNMGTTLPLAKVVPQPRTEELRKEEKRGKMVKEHHNHIR